MGIVFNPFTGNLDITGITAPASIANGGTGQTTQQAAITALTGTQSAGKYLRSDGTNASLSTIQAADVPTLNQNTTGTAANITGTTNSTITTLSSLSLPGSQVTGNISGNAANITATTNNTLVTLSSLSLSGSQVTGNISGNAGNITATSNSTLITLSSLSLPGTQVTGNISGNAGNITGITNSTLLSLPSLTLPGSQVSGNIPGSAANITATTNSTLTSLPSLSLSGSQVSGNISGNSTNVTGIVAISNGGTGQSNQQSAINALAGGITSGSYLRGNGTNVVLSTIQAADIPTLNQNTTGTAANITATSNSTLTTLSSLSLPGGQVTGNISGNAANITATSNSTLTSLPNLILGGSQVSGDISGNAANVNGTVTVAHGGTSLTTTPTNGQLLIGNGTNYTLSTLAQGAGITVTNSSGGINVAMNAGDKAKVDAAVVNQLQTVSSTAFPTTVAGWGTESGTNYTVAVSSRQVVVRGNYAWEITFASPGFIFCYDVTNPYAPVLLSSRPAVTTQTPPGDSGPRSLVVDSAGRYAYMSMSTGQLNIFDYNDKSNPTFVGVNITVEAQLRAGTLTLSPAPSGALFDIVQNGNYLYATDAGNSGTNTGNGFYVIDITNPAAPVQKWQVNLSGGAGRNRTVGIDSIGNYIYVAEFDNNTGTYNQSRLLIYDITSVASAAPTLVGSVALGLGGLGAVTVSPTGNYVYVSNRNNTLSFFVVDTTVKTAPVLKSTVNLAAYGGAADVKSIVTGSTDRFIFISSATTGSLLVYDATTKTAPTLAFTINTGSSSGVGAIALSRGCIYIPNRATLSMDIINGFNYDEYFGTATGSQLTLSKSITVNGADITKASGITNDSSVSGTTVKDALNTLSVGGVTLSDIVIGALIYG